MNDLLIPYTRMKGAKKIVIFGKGVVGLQYLHMISFSRRVEVTAFIDNNAKKGEFINGTPVMLPEELEAAEYDYILLATMLDSVAKSMKNDLLQLGIDEERVIYNGGVAYKSYRKDSFTYRWLSNGSNGRLFIFMLPEHGGTGDYALGYAEQKFLRYYFGDKQIIGVTSEEWLAIKEMIMNIISPKDMLFLNGGGYIGDLWDSKTTTDIYRDIVETFYKNRVFFFPNTLTYREEVDLSNSALLYDMEWFRKHQNIHVSFRDIKSYNIFRENVPNCHYFPDMVLYEHFPRALSASNGKVLLCLRTDIEKIFQSESRLKKVLESYNIEYDQIDLDMNKSISQMDGEELVKRVVKTFQEYSCVITDRLHGMVLATVSDVPCIAFDNLTKKISGVYEWIKDEAVTLLDETAIEGIVQEINKVIKKKSKIGYYKGKKEYFNDMASLIERVYFGDYDEK